MNRIDGALARTLDFSEGPVNGSGTVASRRRPRLRLARMSTVGSGLHSSARARREAWAQRELPFEGAAPPLTGRAIAHRRQMLEHLSRLARQA